MKPLAHRNLFMPVMAALIALAWLTLAVWQYSPYGRYLKHEQLGGIVEAGPDSALAQALLYVAGWTLMTVAMMLPTSLPLLQIFQRMMRQRPDRDRRVALVILGYLSIWLAFGTAAHAFDIGLHEIFERSAWLQENRWFLGAAPLFVAGAFQFSHLKYRCLDKCRAPLSFVMQHWHRGGAPFSLGVRHGAFCVGCCWALMLLMFAVGTGSIGWMLALGAVMAVEKNLSWGRRISAPLGIALLGWSVLIALDHTWSWQA